MSQTNFWIRASLANLAIAVILALVAQGAHAGPRKAGPGDFEEALPESFRFVLLRSYLPADGRDSVQLPSITVVKNGQSTTLPECPWRTTSLRDHRKAERAIASEDYDVKDVVRTLSSLRQIPGSNAYVMDADYDDALSVTRSMSVNDWTMWTSVYELTTGEVRILYKSRPETEYRDFILGMDSTAGGQGQRP